MSILMMSVFMLLIITLFAGIMYIANHTVTELNEIPIKQEAKSKLLNRR